MTPTKSTLNNLSGKEWVRATKSWFVINPKPRTKRQINHPAKYPEELVAHLLRFFTKEDSWVLDPFAGVGSTLIACKEMNRNAVGIELNPEYVEIGNHQIDHTKGKGEIHLLVGDAYQTAEYVRNSLGENQPTFDFLMTSPPYWNMLRKSRGGNDSVHKEREAANSEAYLVVVVQNMRDIDGEMKPIAWDLARRISQTYALKQEMIWCQDNKRLGCWGFPTTYVSNVHHHYCLVFQKR